MTRSGLALLLVVWTGACVSGTDPTLTSETDTTASRSSTTEADRESGTTTTSETHSASDDLLRATGDSTPLEPVPPVQPDDLLTMYRESNRPSDIVSAFSRASTDPKTYQLAIAILLYEEPQESWFWGYFEPADTLSRLRLDSEDLDGRTLDILHEATIGHIVAHVSSGDDGSHAWYNPPTVITVEQSFVGTDRVTGSLALSGDNGRTVFQVSAHQSNGRWVVDGLDWQLDQPEQPEFSFIEEHWTDTTVVHGAEREGGDVITITGSDTTDVTVVEAERHLPVGILTAAPGSRVSVAFGTTDPTWPEVEQRIVGASGALRLGVPPAGLSLRITYLDGSTTVITVDAP